MFIVYLLVSLLSFSVVAVAAPFSESQWFTVEWSGIEFTDVTGVVTVPRLPSDSTRLVYIWPGIQGENGALQAEIKGVSSSLQLRNIFYGQTDSGDSSSDGPVSIAPGDKVHFGFSQDSGGNWFTRLVDTTVARHVNNNFSLLGSNLNRAILAIELVEGIHDFDVQYENLQLTAASRPASEWCSTIASYGFGDKGFLVEGVVADGRKCTITKVTLPRTA